MLRKLCNFKRLSGRERLLLLNAFLLLSSIRLGLGVLSFRTLFRLLKVVSQPDDRSPSAPAPCVRKQYTPPMLACLQTTGEAEVSVNQIIWAVEVVSRLMPGGVKCLARALTTQVLMKRSGYLPALRIGVAKAGNGTLEAHAWVEYQGQVAIGNLQDLSRFLPLPSLEEING